MIVIVLSSILIFSAVISYQTFFSDNQLTVLVNQVKGALRYARYAAITMNANVRLCAKDTDNTCGVNWQEGLLVLNDDNQAVLRIFSAMPAGFQGVWRSTLGDSSDLRWRPTGFTRGQQGSFFICAQNKAALSAKIVILRTGRLRSEVGRFLECGNSVLLFTVGSSVLVT